MRKRESPTRFTEILKFSTSDLDGSVPKPVASDAVSRQAVADDGRHAAFRPGCECICTGQVCCGLQVVTSGMGLFQFCNSYLVKGQRYSKNLRMPLAGRLEGQL